MAIVILHTFVLLEIDKCQVVQCAKMKYVMSGCRLVRCETVAPALFAPAYLLAPALRAGTTGLYKRYLSSILLNILTPQSLNPAPF